jgi:hypothetical protein
MPFGLGLPRLSQNSKIQKSVKKTSSTFAIWRVLISSEGVLMVFFEISGGEFRVLRQSLSSLPACGERAGVRGFLFHHSKNFVLHLILENIRFRACVAWRFG